MKKQFRIINKGKGQLVLSTANLEEVADPSDIIVYIDKQVETRQPKVAGKSLVLDTQIEKLVNLDNTKDVNKPVSTPQENRIQEVVGAQITNSTALTDPTIAIVPTGNVHILGVGPGTYTYWGNQTVPANNIATLRRVGGVFSMSLTPITIPATNTEAWTNEVGYPANTDRVWLGKLWKSNAVTATTDIPGTSTKWVEVLSGYVENSDVEIYNKNIFDKTSAYAVADKGVGNDGVVFTAAGFGAIEGLPVLANTSYVISGCPALRGLRFETANGTLISFIGTISNGTAFTTPALTARITFQAYATTTGNMFNLVQVEKGTVATAYSAYNPVLKSVFGAEIKYYNTEIYSKLESGALFDKIENKIGDFPYSKVLQATVAFTPTGNYFINSSGGVDSGFAGDKATGFIPVDSDAYYRYLGKFTDARGYAEYDINQVFIKGSRASVISPSNSIVTDYKFKTSSTTKFVRFSVYEVASYQLYKDSQTIDDVLDELSSNVGITTVDYTSDVPAYIFGIDNDSSFYAREYVQNLYPESLLGQKVDVKVNGGRVANIQTQIKNTAVKNTRVITITLSGKGYITKSSNVDLVKTKASNAKNKQIRYLAIGDSITANQIPKEDATFVGGWCYPSVAKEILMMDNKDFGDNAIKMLLLGTTNYKETTFPYKSETLTLRGLSEGRGSWTTCNYLRHAAHTTTTSSGTGSGFNNKAAWDAMGLGRKIAIDFTYDEGVSYETYTYTTTQRNLIRTTSWGKYHWDYSTELWTALKVNNIGGIMTGAGTYTESAGDKTLIDTAMNYILDNPHNPFYDKIIAKTTGTHAFSLTTYLSRYKTLADDGVTRLVVGSTAGSKITSLNINTIDVATPTHITVELGENERWWFPATAQNAFDDNVAIMNIISTEFPTIKTGFVNPRYIGVMYPDYWADKAICGSFDPAGSNLFKYQMNTIAKAYFGALASQTNKFFLPCYYTQSPLFRQQSRYDVNLVDKSNIIVGSTDPNHPGLLGYWGMGYDVLAWIYYTL